MIVLKSTVIGLVKAGDTVVINNERFFVDFIEPAGYCYEMQLRDSLGTKVSKCLSQVEMVSIQL